MSGPRRLAFGAAGFETGFAALLAPRGAPAEVAETVAGILAEVRAEGLPAVLRYNAKFDPEGADEPNLLVSQDEIEAGARTCPVEVREAIAMAARRIGDYHQRLRPADGGYTDAAGVELGWRWTPLAAVGIYVPGGRAAYPSTVLMNAVPAAVAGVRRIAMACPRLTPAVLAAAQAAGVAEIWRLGGAQAVAALAYGAGPIRPVDKIVGPGNAYVTEAKRAVFGAVGIDSLAGPSEVVVVADAASDPAWIAADLLAQAEHDPDAQAILITDDAAFADAVARSVEAELATLPTAETAAAAWRTNGAIVVAPLAQAAGLVDRIAPEHLELALADPAAFAAGVSNAGAIFLGRHAPEAVGDYVAGPNHVLPTSGAARFASGLSTLDFLKRTSLTACDAQAFATLAEAAQILAEAEGLAAHARSIAIRRNREP